MGCPKIGVPQIALNPLKGTPQNEYPYFRKTPTLRREATALCVPVNSVKEEAAFTQGSHAPSYSENVGGLGLFCERILQFGRLTCTCQHNFKTWTSHGCWTSNQAFFPVHGRCIAPHAAVKLTKRRVATQLATVFQVDMTSLHSEFRAQVTKAGLLSHRRRHAPSSWLRLPASYPVRFLAARVSFGLTWTPSAG